MKSFIKIKNIVFATNMIASVVPSGDVTMLVELRGTNNNLRQITYETKAERDAAFKIIVKSLTSAR